LRIECVRGKEKEKGWRKLIRGETLRITPSQQTRYLQSGADEENRERKTGEATTSAAEKDGSDGG